MNAFPHNRLSRFQDVIITVDPNKHSYVSVPADTRITEDDHPRMTEDGDVRIVE